jgi:benzoyl-CoA reductase/2-hydroxyglutaryl-CoA dehydratase subunit BcrC/BadD/HgdB
VQDSGPAPSPLSAARERYRQGWPADGSERIVVGIVGASVPVELVLAAGMIPVRLSGGARPTPLADAYELDRLDRPATAAFEQLLDPERRFECALIGGDGEAGSVLFQTLREIRRIESGRSLPQFSFVDLLHLPFRTTARYDRGQLGRLVGTLAGWSGRPITAEAITEAVATVNETRSHLAGTMELRRVRPARLSGTDALRLAGAALVSTPEEIQGWLSQITARSSDLPELTGPRVYLTGATHEDPTAYEALEKAGCVIVGEDHPRGQDALGPEVELTNDPLDGLVEHYQFANLPSRRSSADRARHAAAGARAADADVVVHFAFRDDEATPWDRPATKEAVEAAGLRWVALDEDGLEVEGLAGIGGRG